MAIIKFETTSNETASFSWIYDGTFLTDGEHAAMLIAMFSCIEHVKLLQEVYVSGKQGKDHARRFLFSSNSAT